MAGMEHPPIEFILHDGPSLERLFAEEAYQILDIAGMIKIEQMDGVLVNTLMSERCDVYSSEKSKLALRLKSVPVLSYELAQTGLSSAPSKNYYVIEFQYGKLTDFVDGQDIEDEDFDWHPYVSIVINCNDTKEISVHNNITGKELDTEEFARAFFALKIMRDRIRGMQFENEVAIGNNDADVRTNWKKYGEFVPAEFMDNSHCCDCGVDNVPCEHNPYTQN